jgi:uncharacterized DUF497 family protein
MILKLPQDIMGKTVVSADGHFEWDDAKDRLNIKNHGFSFNEILEIFDDPAFLEGYDAGHSLHEDRYYGIGCLNNVVYIVSFYTYRAERRRIISARQADPDEQEEYHDYFKKIIG